MDPRQYCTYIFFQGVYYWLCHVVEYQMEGNTIVGGSVLLKHMMEVVACHCKQ